MLKRIISCFSFLLIGLLSAHAYQGEYRIGKLSSFEHNFLTPTHVIVVGSAVKEDSDQFFRSGLARAIRIKEVYPLDQIILISSPEVVDRDDEKVFADFNINVIKFVEETFTQEKLIRELSEYKKIRSINFYGHSSPWAFKLGKKDAAFDPSSVEKQLVKIKDNFTTDAYAIFHSCNSGFNIATSMARILNIAVAGTLTSGLFERIESDGFWYKESDRHEGQYVYDNSVSFKERIDCKWSGACVRMKPSRSNYSSYWGQFDKGLGFTKFFCPKNKSMKDCEMAMANSVITFPSIKAIDLNSSLTDVKSVIFDWLCLTAKDPQYFSQCVKGIEDAIARGDDVFKSHSKDELRCDFEKCYAKVVCKDKIFGSGPRGGSCKIEGDVVTDSKQVVTEFKALLNGFKSILKSH